MAFYNLTDRDDRKDGRYQTLEVGKQKNKLTPVPPKNHEPQASSLGVLSVNYTVLLRTWSICSEQLHYSEEAT